MKTKVNRIAAVALAVASGLPTPAAAGARADFRAQCSWSAGHDRFSCDFDARLPAASASACPGSYIWKYFWDFDDGATLLTGSPTASHAFPNGQDRLVNLRLICAGGDIVDRLRHVCTTVGTPGCLQVNGGWN